MKSALIQEMLNDFSNGTYDFTDNEKCTGCGECCSNFLPMTKEEISAIRRYVKKHNIKECKHNLPLASPMVIDMTCPFLDTDKKSEKCRIYEARPKICRDFICCPSKRPNIDRKHQLKAMPVNVRGTFFRKEG